MESWSPGIKWGLKRSSENRSLQSNSIGLNLRLSRRLLRSELFEIIIKSHIFNFITIYLLMQRGVRANLRSNKSKEKIKRSKSKSRSPSPQRKQPNKKKKPLNSSNKNKRNRSRSLARSRSRSKNKVARSASNRKVNRSLSPPRLGSSDKKKRVNISRKNSGKNNSILRSPDRKVAKDNPEHSRKL